MEYREPGKISKHEMEAIVSTGSPAVLCSALIDATHSIEDAVWLLDLCGRLMNNPSAEVRSAAVISIGHLARIHSKLPVEMILPPLQNLFMNEPALRGVIDDVIEDIKIFSGVDISRALINMKPMD